MTRPPSRLRDTILPLALLSGDVVMTLTGLSAGYYLRYESPLRNIGIIEPDASFPRYLPLILVGVAMLIGAFAQFGLYDSRLVLRRYQSLNGILKGAAFWLLAYLGISLVLKFDPPISRVFVTVAFVCVVLLLYLWRSFAHKLVTSTSLLDRLRRRTILVGWNNQARAIAETIAADRAHPFALAGIVTTPGSTSPFPTSMPPSGEAAADFLGSIDDLESIIARQAADQVVITRLDLPRADVQRIVDICERTYVEWKIIPDSFDIFLSSLRLHTVGRVPLLGVDELAINRLFNRVLKRTLDIVGAVIGLAISTPIIAILAILIKRESPDGPVFFSQTRIGARHRPFTLWKLRSMVPQASKTALERWSTARSDPRLLRIGAFMRRWNLDETPQFWNVLRGNMSLVGPRPEMPHHVDRLSSEVSHYLPRHLVKPGMSGWAQVNGLRGDTSIEERIQHDIYYIENWSIWLDVQIILLTFVRWKNAY